MFVYLLIAAEIAVLYAAFWYLYGREPQRNRRISGELWGSYESMIENEQAYGELAREYVLDVRTNHYVPAEDARDFLHKLSRQVDGNLSQLNVRN